MEEAMQKVTCWQDCLTQSQRNKLTLAAVVGLKKFLSAVVRCDVLKPIKLGVCNGQTLGYYPKDEDSQFGEGGLMEIIFLRAAGRENLAKKVEVSDDKLRRLVQFYELLPRELARLRSSLTADLSDQI